VARLGAVLRLPVPALAGANTENRYGAGGEYWWDPASFYRAASRRPFPPHGPHICGVARSPVRRLAPGSSAARRARDGPSASAKRGPARSGTITTIRYEPHHVWRGLWKWN
jgi:hypothetical protein